MPLARGTERASLITALISSVAALAQVCNLILTNTLIVRPVLTITFANNITDSAATVLPPLILPPQRYGIRRRRSATIPLHGFCIHPQL